MDASVAMPTESIFLIALHSPKINRCACIAQSMIQFSVSYYLLRSTRSDIIAQRRRFCRKKQIPSQKCRKFGKNAHASGIISQHDDA
jgi:hypothetical protein